MSRWWRAYDEAVDDPKLCLLTDKQHRAWFNVCCITSQNGGRLPPMADVAFKMRITTAKAKAIVAELIALALVDMGDDGTAAPHNWHLRQFKSDVTDPTAAARMRRYRSSNGINRNADRNASVSVTVPRAETEQKTETERKEDTADAVPTSVAPYAFESGVIRLRQKDFDQWKQAFSHLDVPAELLALSEWAGAQGQKWFFAVSSALAKKNREIGVRIEQTKSAPAYRWNGMEGVT